MSIVLKPCPFCASDNTEFAAGQSYRWLTVQCADCGAMCGESRRTNHTTWSDKDKQAAADIWNSRP